MPNPGDIEYKYGRVYIYGEPDPQTGLGTWRVAVQDEISGGGGGGGGGTGVTYDFDGEAPIEVNTTPGIGSNPSRVVTSLDINKLQRNTDI